ncbi:MAG: M18 family aminopeptidase [Cellvibrionales bacterium TMED49]|nr:M18 family aminopeptidase [Porticoccaceae bacterium]OUU35310.1 MAG: M18 family aminopeptidase [Cellvibrionales bacterium TMED49]RPG88204.1 MAG: M18 family aminopeptidase [Cellvibrionales bacterium TMED148]
MKINKSKLNNELREFLNLSPTSFHATEQLSKLLLTQGYKKLYEEDEWVLEKGGKYFVVRNQSSLIAFIMGRSDPVKYGVRMAGAHTDSPCLMIKPNPDITKNGYLQLGVEVYGGALLNPWFDRDLSIAGRIIFQNSSGKLHAKLIDFKRPVAIIPSLAIHLDRGANKNRSINAQTDIPPILMRTKNKQNFRQILDSSFLSNGESVIDYELSLYDTQKAINIGISEEFLVSARLDNLLSCYVAAKAISVADQEHNCILVCSDHEEIGSVSSSGSDGPFLESVLDRMIGNDLVRNRAMKRSLFISCDSAHAMHPNFKSLHDERHQPLINEGPVIKVNAKQRYATNSVTSSVFRKICSDADIPLQTFVSRSDLGCGSTIGPIVSARLGIPTIDVGIPQLAMHSCRETAGVKDPIFLEKGLTTFFEYREPVAITNY